MNIPKSYTSKSLLDIDNADNSDTLIEEFLKENYNIKGLYTIKDGIVDVKGDLRVINKNITRLTNGLFRFGKVRGFFDCSSCNLLKTLDSAPQEVTKIFNCSLCHSLTSLEGAPREVGGSFCCYECDSLVSLEDAPRKVGGNFFCDHCTLLTSLKGTPEKVGGDFDCSYCKSLTSLEGAPKKVGGSFYCGYCGRQFTKKEMTNICKVNRYII